MKKINQTPAVYENSMQLSCHHSKCKAMSYTISSNFTNMRMKTFLQTTHSQQGTCTFFCSCLLVKKKKKERASIIRCKHNNFLINTQHGFHNNTKVHFKDTTISCTCVCTTQNTALDAEVVVLLFSFAPYCHYLA